MNGEDSLHHTDGSDSANGAYGNVVTVCKTQMFCADNSVIAEFVICADYITDHVGGHKNCAEGATCKIKVGWLERANDSIKFLQDGNPEAIYIKKSRNWGKPHRIFMQPQ